MVLCLNFKFCNYEVHALLVLGFCEGDVYSFSKSCPKYKITKCSCRKCPQNSHLSQGGVASSSVRSDAWSGPQVRDDRVLVNSGSKLLSRSISCHAAKEFEVGLSAPCKNILPENLLPRECMHVQQLRQVCPSVLEKF